MKCDASPITSSAEPVRSAPYDRRAVDRLLEGELFRTALAPLAAAMGPIGETVVASGVRALFGPSSERPS